MTLHMIEKHGKPFGFADEKQISTHRLKLYVAPAPVGLPVEEIVDVAPEPEAPKAPIRKAR